MTPADVLLEAMTAATIRGNSDSIRREMCLKLDASMRTSLRVEDAEKEA